ncbi:NifB/NifX family molybdenum-iron cluster-binding protein [Pectinatus haikarae]|uniref:Fe-Mo cluster-binding NifX family protein n=1 Tax=Pectinatus haikarae TaxID=349096 RepID=A0ABT9YBA7_9FIRM|nr:NifB/NifX family molybdenum-iron cluster-binding protein [Pectinatus haikarae]MDQ0204507.1 putative Fe-Mo cluster-binding NifX family protein [Pectinatus haikarae]
MSYKIAAASSDGIYVDRHFGHADLFYITEISDGGMCRFLEKRTVLSPCRHGVHDLQIMQEAVKLIADCQYVLCEAVGAGAAAILGQHHITPLETDESIDNAIRNIILYKKRVKNLQRTCS